MISSPKYKLSLNSRLIDKIAPSETKFYAEDFDPVDLTLDQLERSINEGIAFSYQFDKGYRRTEYFLASGILVIEIDGGLTIEECLQIPIVDTFGSLLYTTPSHSPDHHRFRLIFGLPRTIIDPNELRYASRALAQRLGGDMRQTNPAAVFLGSRGCHFKRLRSSVSDELLDDLIQDGCTELANDSISNNRPTAHRSYRRLPATQSVTLANGTRSTIRDVVGSQPVYCPFHLDQQPSAFVAMNKGNRFLHCSHCKKTWWMSGKGHTRDSSAEFDDLIKAIKGGALPADLEKLGPLEQEMGIDRLLPKNILIANERYLNAQNLKTWDLSNGITFVKSPKGSGKSTFLAGLLRQATTRFATFEDFENADEPEGGEPFYTKEKVLLVGHRQALIGELCGRLGLNCYLDDDPNSSKGLLQERRKRYGVCLDSLRKVEQIKYDIVVIDEVEQVLGHFLAETLGEKRRTIFKAFVRLIREARQIVLLDADLSWPSFKAMEIIRSMGGYSNSADDILKTPIRFYLNSWTDEARSINIYDDQDHLIHELKDAILSGERVFVSSNSKRKIDALAQVVKELEDRSGILIPHVSITSANSKSAEIQTLIGNIKTEILKYKVVLSSPSLGTGVDITFENNGKEIDRVFGFFEARVTSHYEIDQQLARVRHPKQVDVWVSPERFNFETQFEVIVEDLLHSDLIYSVQDGMHWIDRNTLADKDPFLAVAALVVSKDRASKNRLKLNFVEHKQAQGWSVNTVTKDGVLADKGMALLNEGKLRSFHFEAQNLLDAATLREDEFDAIKERAELGVDVVSLNERYQYDRTRLELFYREEATVELIEKDGFGRYREKIYLYEQLTNASDGDINFKHFLEYQGDRKITRARVEILKDRRIAVPLLAELLGTTPLFEGQKFLCGVEYSTGDFEEFTSRSLKLRRFVDAQFGLRTRRDVTKKPIQHLDQLLKLVGLKSERTRKKKNGRKTTYFYRIEPDLLNGVESVCRRRQEITAWKFVNEQYGFM